MKILAVVAFRDELDVLQYSIPALIEQGIDVYCIDHHSVDGMEEIMRQYPIVGYEKFPPDGDNGVYNWTAILKRKAEIFAENYGTYDWCLHHDADEFRYAPVDDFLGYVHATDVAGYNAIDFVMYEFCSENGTPFGSDPRKLTRCSYLGLQCRQVKLWKNRPEIVDLETHGGHLPIYNDINVSPVPFILCHYPFRSKMQIEMKIESRRRMYAPEELQKGWHHHYDKLSSDIGKVAEDVFARQHQDGIITFDLEEARRKIKNESA